MSVNTCSICNHEDADRLEDLGQQALDGAISWRQAARDGGLPHHQSLKNHMEKHYAQPPTTEEEAMSAVESDINLAVEELLELARLAPAEVRPFYLAAARNLAGLLETKPSQQHLIQSLKAVHEVTGMKMEQRLMLEFAQAQFGLGASEASAELETAREVIDVDVEEASA